MVKFPAVTLLRFWFNHGFLGLSGQHQWRTVDGGSREYVRRLVTPFEDRIHTRTPVVSVRREAQGVEVTTTGESAGTHRFDRVILAAHADQSLRMLKDPTPLENELLKPFAYQPNDVDLHTDRGFMPKKRLAWAAWNYRSSKAGEASTHYWMNCLQGVSEKTDYFVSLNTRDEIAPEAMQRQLQYEHPLFDLDAIKTQPRLPELNGQGRTYFCGSYFRYGFHEDAFKSAVDLCTTILKGDPWPQS
jgi:predicted NAD/FAD-binding protein